MPKLDKVELNSNLKGNLMKFSVEGVDPRKAPPRSSMGIQKLCYVKKTRKKLFNKIRPKKTHKNSQQLLINLKRVEQLIVKKN